MATAPNMGRRPPGATGSRLSSRRPIRRSRRLTFDATRAPRTESQQLTLVGRPVRAGQLGSNGPAMPHIACDDRRNGHHSGGADSAHLVANPAPPNTSFMMPLGSDILQKGQIRQGIARAATPYWPYGVSLRDDGDQAGLAIWMFRACRLVIRNPPGEAGRVLPPAPGVALEVSGRVLARAFIWNCQPGADGRT